MSRDLSLLPVTVLSEADGYSHAVLPMQADSDPDLFAAIDALPVFSKPEFTLNSYLSWDETAERHVYGATPVDDTEGPLTYALASWLVEAAGSLDLCSANRAAIAYLRELRPTTMVALFWR